MTTIIPIVSYLSEAKHMAKDEILTLNEAAKFLNMSPETLVNLVSQKELKGIKVGNQWRFFKEEIELWKDTQDKPNVEKIALENVVSRFFSFINSDFILRDLNAKHRFEVLASMSQFAKENSVCTKQSWLFDMLSKRERLISTGIGNGVAFLHPRSIHSDKINFSAVLLGISQEGVDFRSLDRTPVNLFFLLLLKTEQQHLFALSYLSQLFREDHLKEKIMKASDNKAILDLLKLQVE